MILPSRRTLFGIRLIVVFNERFREQFSTAERYVHLAATSFVAILVALRIAPAVNQRHAETASVSRRFVGLATRLLAFGPDFCLIATLVTEPVVGEPGYLPWPPCRLCRVVGLPSPSHPRVRRGT